MEICVNEYIRTKDGIIRKYHHSDIHYGDVLIRTDKKDIIYDFEIVKHSPNIIDLIEEGDYVNGKEVKHIAWFEGVPDYPKLIFADEHRLIPGETAENDEIKSVVTKEQFNQMKYIVGDESNVKD